jgi:hypothetical protein
MQKRLWGIAAVAVMAVALAGIVGAQGEPPERWLHVRVDSSDEKGETVRVNLPLNLAEKILPAVKANVLEDGKVQLKRLRVNEVDIRAILEAVKNSADGEFVTVQSRRETVRVAKKSGYLIVEVRDERPDRAERVDIKVPMVVVEAMLTGAPDELDVLAGIRALKAQGDMELVTVKERKQTVRIWIDSKSTTE